EAPSMLGTAPEFGGVRGMPEALLGAGLAEAIGARRAGRVEPQPYVPGRDPQTQVTNVHGLREYALRLADAVGDVLNRGAFPVVLGGDCSILLGSLLGAARRGRHGVVFIDGHIDFYPPEINEWDGRAANSELAFAAGRGPTALTDFGIGRPLVRDDDIVAVGFRDQANQAKYGRALPATALAISRQEVRDIGPAAVAARAVGHLTRPGGPDGYFVHFDADAIDGKLMPAVDDPSPDGFQWEEAIELLRAVTLHERAVGIQLTIYNPDADPDGSVGRALAGAIGAALNPMTSAR
ncbi:MAG: arginase family protein, partial [Geminicoccales bacterium]